MARKTSDIALLLGSRGRSRKGGPLGRLLRGIRETWFGRSPWREERPSRSVQVPGWLATAGILAAFAGGYLAGGRTAGAASPGAGLHAKGAETPRLIGEADTERLNRTAFVVSFYPDLAAEEAKEQARALARWLATNGLEKARAYEHRSAKGDFWLTVVYYANETEERATRQKLQALPEDVPDASFVYLRKSEAEWPRPMTIQ